MNKHEKKKRQRIKAVLCKNESERILASGGSILFDTPNVRYLQGSKVGKVTAKKLLDADYINGGNGYYNVANKETTSVKITSKAPQNAMRKAEKMHEIFAKEVGQHEAEKIYNLKQSFYNLSSRQRKKYEGLTDYIKTHL